MGKKKTPHKLVITIGGLHGVGKSTYAASLAKRFRLRHVSAGDTFRKIAEKQGVDFHSLTLRAAKEPAVDRLVDELTKKEARIGDVVIEGQLAAWMTQKRSNINLLLSAAEETRFKRISARDAMSVDEARRQTLARELVERKRYERYYNINIADLSIYDIILNTELLPLESNIDILHRIVNKYLETRRATK